MNLVNFLVAVSIGGFVGAGELVARYRDSPVRALSAPSAWFYILINAGSSAAALGLILAFGWKFGQTGEAARWTQVLVAGFGSMALFRSSLFTVRIGDEDVAIGPSSFLQVTMNAADRGVDRSRAKYRAKFVGEKMASVSFDKAKEALPAYCAVLMQNLPSGQLQDLKADVEALDQTPMDSTVKSLSLGLRLMNLVGPTVLEQAVESLGDQITT